MWFKRLTGFDEKSGDFVREELIKEDDYFISRVNNKRFAFGELEIPTLLELKDKASLVSKSNNKLKVSEVVGDVQELHCSVENVGALFQAASQFNLLEMTGPNIIPEDGIDRYENDFTQGPACAIACGAGTIYRNYFAQINGQIGQSKTNQIDCLDDIAKALDNEKNNLWRMQNGYALVNLNGLLHLNKTIASFNYDQREQLKSKLKVGIQWNTEVTISESYHRVSQIYCSALPVAYGNSDTIYWEYFAKLILEAAYEATLYTALINLDRYGSNSVFLTLLGGGAFGNDENWIIEALELSLLKFKSSPLDIKIVSYKTSNSRVMHMINKITYC